MRKSLKGQHHQPVMDLPKKSQSMGALKTQQNNALPTVHKKRTTNQKEGATTKCRYKFN